MPVKSKPKKLIAVVELSDDETGKVWNPGDEVAPDDFPAQVIENWLELGALRESDNGGE